MAEAQAAGENIAIKRALSDFLDWIATPPGWPTRCLLAEGRKNRDGNFSATLTDRTVSSGGVLPWAFGHPDAESGLFDALGSMIPTELGIKFLRRLGNSSGMSSNVFEIEVLGRFHAAYKVCLLSSRRSPLEQERAILARLTAITPRYVVAQYDVRQFEGAVELIADGSTLHDWVCSEAAPQPGTAARLAFVRRCNALVLDAMRQIHDNDTFHADLKPQNILLQWSAPAANSDGANSMFTIKVIDWEQDNWPVAADNSCSSSSSRIIRRLRDNLMLGRLVAALYADLHVRHGSVDH